MKKFGWILLAGLAFSGGLQAQKIEEVLQSVEQHNKELQASAHSMEAAKMEVQTRNNLEDPSVEYSPFYASNVDGMASSELVVTQGFDFPTLYAARNRSGKSRKIVLDRQQQVLRRDILLQAKNLCLDLIWLNQEQQLLAERMKNADALLELFEKRLKEGDANALEVNKIKMERMKVQTEVAQNNAAHRTALQQLLAMNGNMPLEFAETDYPKVEAIRGYQTLYNEVMQSDADLQVAEATVQAASEEVKVNKQNWLPKLEVGYRRNTSVGEKTNGFLVGGSFPLFSNRKKLKIAKAQALSANLQRDNARLQVEAKVQSQFNEMQQLHEAMQAYDVPLMHHTLRLLYDAVTAGQLSIIDFYVEADNVYGNLQSYMTLENQYQKLMADIYKNRL